VWSNDGVALGRRVPPLRGFHLGIAAPGGRISARSLLLSTVELAPMEKPQVGLAFAPIQGKGGPSEARCIYVIFVLFIGQF
jgi:hypothetical protein